MEIPIIEISASERKSKVLEKETIDIAKQAFLDQGAIILTNVFSSDEIQFYKNYLESRHYLNLIRTTVDDRRPLFSLDIQGPLAKTALLTSSFIDPIARSLLSETYILGACGLITSFPGAPQQFIHRDSASLYSDYSLDIQLPPYAITMLMPLIDANSETGSTRIWPGTHHIASDEEAKSMPSESPDVCAGSVLLTDSRVLHCGAANNSNKIRPTVYFSYHREWFRDNHSYPKRPPFNVPFHRRLSARGPAANFVRVGCEQRSGYWLNWTLRRLYTKYTPINLQRLFSNYKEIDSLDNSPR